jgi:hypothetical protein
MDKLIKRVRTVLQSPAKKDHTIFITIGVRVNYGDAEANDCYSSERISEILGDMFKCEICGDWHLNTESCGMDNTWLDDIRDVGDKK